MPQPAINVERFAQWLTGLIGLDPASLGGNAIEHAVRSCAGSETADDYWRRLMDDPHEQQRLIDRVIVPETWFFRDEEAFAALASVAAAKLAAAPAQRLRILSLPCSTGEEPYSAAIALLDAGIDASRFTIDAADISVTSIAAARRAVYGRNAFRRNSTAQQALKQRYFDEVAGGLRPVDAVRASVRLRQANLFDAASLPPGGYDFVFCRNVLIYFDRARQASALQTLTALLADGGLLFVSPAESGAMLRAGFTPAKIPRAFAFRPQAAAVAIADMAGMPSASEAARARHATPLRFASPPAVPAARDPLGVRGSPTLRRPAIVSALETFAEGASLVEVARRADAGDLGAAQKLLDNYLITQAPSAEAYYLRGLIADAANAGAAARDAYKKALYLEPEHTGALAHLAARLELEGDHEGAQRLMRRVARLAGKNVATSDGSSRAER